MNRFRLTTAPIIASRFTAELADPRLGALASFEGRVRDHHQGRAVRALDYQAYELLAQREGERLCTEALQRFDVLDLRAVHRTGALAIGDVAVLVAVSASHRDPAFEACRWLLDAIKASVPIWKNEHYVDGESGWIHPQS